MVIYCSKNDGGSIKGAGGTSIGVEKYILNFFYMIFFTWIKS